MRNLAVFTIAFVALGFGACTRKETDSTAREAGRKAGELAREVKKGADITAKKARQVGRQVVVETEKAAKKAKRELNGVANEANKGWNEGAKK
jgi:hypothetical protein